MKTQPNGYATRRLELARDGERIRAADPQAGAERTGVARGAGHAVWLLIEEVVDAEAHGGAAQKTIGLGAEPVAEAAVELELAAAAFTVGGRAVVVDDL